MKLAIIGRSELMYETAKILYEKGYSIPLVITAKEAPEYKKTSEDFRIFAERIDAKFFSTSKINDEQIRNAILEVGPIDLGVSINYSGIISEDIISIFKIGILNAHGGDLPRYRGNACQAWAIINRESHISLCIHKMIGGELDSGDIIEKDYFPIDINTRVGEVWEWMSYRIPDMILTAVKKLEEDPEFFLESQSKDPKEALRCYPRNPEDGRVDWRENAETIISLINASSEPYAGAFCEFENKKLIIWRAELLNDQEKFLAIPGQICNISDLGIVVSTGNGKIFISEVEYENKRINPSRMIRSIRKRLK
jgi:UDP-4-amino-4-deoxy-L-arabinose formyltransferase/UDP-glucuronic acid dehydrogenase (UDP-4-keto-hexauronic acid decarboxylating)